MTSFIAEQTAINLTDPIAGPSDLLKRLYTFKQNLFPDRVIEKPNISLTAKRYLDMFPKVSTQSKPEVRQTTTYDKIAPICFAAVNFNARGGVKSQNQ